ncbi:VOC family protein [Streptomyces fumanus]
MAAARAADPAAVRPAGCSLSFPSPRQRYGASRSGPPAKPAEIGTASAFWHRLLGGSIHRTPAHHFIQVPGLPVLVVRSAPGHTAPSWPDGASQQVHLDFGAADLATADRRATAAGATGCAPPRRSPLRPVPAVASTPARPDIPSACGRPETAPPPPPVGERRSYAGRSSTRPVNRGIR